MNIKYILTASIIAILGVSYLAISYRADAMECKDLVRAYQVNQSRAIILTAKGNTYSAYDLFSERLSNKCNI